MADWFRFYNDGLDEPRFQFAISEQPLVTSVWLVILSEASKKRCSKITWRDADFELLGFARKVNVSAPIFNQCVGLLERIGYIKREEGSITIPGWEQLQSNYARGVDRGYYKDTNKTLVSKSLDTSVRGEERRGDKSRKGTKAPSAVVFKEFPEHLRTARIMNKWQVWMTHRRAFKKAKDWNVLFNEQIEWLSKYSEPDVFEILSASIRNGWQGLFEPKAHNNGEPSKSTGWTNEQILSEAMR